jgi:hypothetical protein
MIEAPSRLEPPEPAARYDGSAFLCLNRDGISTIEGV